MKKNLILRISGSAFTILTLFVVFLIGGGNAFAASTSPAHHVTKITVYMHVVSTANNSKTPQSVTPDGTTFGNCGTLEFYIDDYGGGNAGFWMLVSSNRGSITSLSYSVNWYNWSRTYGSSFGQSFGPVSNPWYQEPEKYTRTGFVTGSINATDTTGGIICSGYENDSNTIT